MKKLIIKLIEWYQHCVSPYKGGSCCRFTPTCSQYGKEAVARFGVLKGGALTAYRILRCNPLCKGGYDPVPEKKQKSTHKQAQYPLACHQNDKDKTEK